MATRYRFPIYVGALLMAGTACSKIPNATQQYSEWMNESREAGTPWLDDMADNATLHDMAVADFHFVPHSAEISGTGEARLDRMAPMLSHYGGTVRYETSSTDKALVDQRIAHVKEYLKLAGCDMAKVKVESMISGGRGMPAERAMKIAEKGTAPTSGSGAPMGVMAGAASGQSKP